MVAVVKIGLLLRKFAVFWEERLSRRLTLLADRTRNFYSAAFLRATLMTDGGDNSQQNGRFEARVCWNPFTRSFIVTAPFVASPAANMETREDYEIQNIFSISAQAKVSMYC